MRLGILVGEGFEGELKELFLFLLLPGDNGRLRGSNPAPDGSGLRRRGGDGDGGSSGEVDPKSVPDRRRTNTGRL